MEDFALFQIADLSRWTPTLMLVIFRMAGLFLLAPLLSNSALPAVVKAMMAIVMALGVTANMAVPVTLPNSLVAVVLAIASETLIGAVLGYAAGMMFLGVEIAGQHMGQQMGIALANIYDPNTNATGNVMSTVLNMVALAVFVLSGGHRLVIEAMMGTFNTVPLMGFSATNEVLEMAISLLTAAFVLGFKLAAPVLIVLMLASVAMGLIQRTMPQFNILSSGFQIRIMVATIVVFLTMAAVIPLMRQMWNIIDHALEPVMGV